MGYPIATAVIYVFREAYIVLIIEQYWSLVNSTLTPKQARWINGPFCAIATIGSVTGGSLVAHLAPSLGSEVLLLFAAGSLLPAALFAMFAYTAAGEPQPTVVEEGGQQGHTGLKVLARSRYLVFLFLLILTTQVVSTVLDLRFNGLVETDITDKDMRTAFYGRFYGQWLGISAFVLQLCAGLVLRFIPIRILHPGHSTGSSDCGCGTDYDPFSAEWCDRIPAFQGIGLLSFPSRKRDSLYPLVVRCPLSSETGHRLFRLSICQRRQCRRDYLSRLCYGNSGSSIFYHRDGDGNPLVRDCVELDKTVPES